MRYNLTEKGIYNLHTGVASFKYSATIGISNVTCFLDKMIFKIYTNTCNQTEIQTCQILRNCF